MSANSVAREVPIQLLERIALPESRTLQLAVAGALLAAAAHFGIMREYPEVDAPPDAIALAAFGRALLEQLPAQSTVSAALRPSFALLGPRTEDSSR